MWSCGRAAPAERGPARVLPLRHRDGTAATGEAHSTGCLSDRELSPCGTLHTSASGPSTSFQTSDIGEPRLSHPFTPKRIQTKRHHEQAEHEPIEPPGAQI
ncbi:hypothetical protein [Synechococcus sp. MIT S9220]|uniref:hypothetical protein n=1 Tax=Synechococcus sp. MIT S9220 TaxID=166309 RepID=UPI0039B49D28